MSAFICMACGYPARNETHCDNPACLDNPTLSEAHKQGMRDRAAKLAADRAAEDERRSFRDRLRKQGFLA